MGVVKLSQWLSFQKDMPLSVFPVERKNNVTAFRQLYYYQKEPFFVCVEKNSQVGCSFVRDVLVSKGLKVLFTK